MTDEIKCPNCSMSKREDLVIEVINQTYTTIRCLQCGMLSHAKVMVIHPEGE